VLTQGPCGRFRVGRAAVLGSKHYAYPPPEHWLGGLDPCVDAALLPCVIMAMRAMGTSCPLLLEELARRDVHLGDALVRVWRLP